MKPLHAVLPIRPRARAWIVCAALAMILANNISHATPLYTLSPLIDPLYPGAPTTGVDINDHGVVVADTHLSGPGDGWFLWRDGVAEEPYWYDGYHYTPLAINNRGQVSGYIGTSISSDGWLWTDGSYQQLAELGGGPYFNRPFALNDFGESFGLSYRGPGNSVVAVSWTEGGSVSDLGISFPDFTFYRPNDSNNQGVLVGWADGSSPQKSRAWIRKGGQATILPLPAETANQASSAFAVNRWGQIAGHYYNGVNGFGIVWSGEEIEVLENLPLHNGLAMDINDGGYVVGIANAGFERHAVIWDPNGDIAKLADRTAGAAGWLLEDANAINNRGDIVGVGIDPRGIRRGFVLTRIVPEPPAMRMLAAGLLLLCCGVAWQKLRTDNL